MTVFNPELNTATSIEEKKGKEKWKNRVQDTGKAVHWCSTELLFTKILNIPTKMQLEQNTIFGTDAAVRLQLYNTGLNRRCIAGSFTKCS